MQAMQCQTLGLGVGRLNLTVTRPVSGCRQNFVSQVQQRHARCRVLARAKLLSEEDTLGVENLLERDWKDVDLTDNPFLEEDAKEKAVNEEQLKKRKKESRGAGTSLRRLSKKARASARQQRSGNEGTAEDEEEEQASVSDGPQTARAAIDAGMEFFAAGKYDDAVDMFLTSLELPGSGAMRMSGTIREFSCPSEGEENAALYNMACAYAQLGERADALRCLEAALDNNFEDYSGIRNDPDLAPIRGSELDQLLGRYDGIFAGFMKKKAPASERKPWDSW